MRRSTVARLFGATFLLFLITFFSTGAPGIAQDHPESPGVQIHHSIVQDYGFEYSLYNFPERKTQHLMVSISGPDNAPVLKGKVGFLVTGPDGSKQKSMAMGMQGAYGADMNFQKKGIYTIKTKAVFGNQKLFDQFNYEVKQEPNGHQ